MSTNYYAVVHPDLWQKLHGATQSLHLHIGLSAAGSCFLLHVHPHIGIRSLTTWYRVMLRHRKSVTIEDEYGRTLALEKLLDIITKRSWPHARTGQSPYQGREFGPNNLLRAKVDGNHIIRHGPGTWDIVVGEFN